MNELKPYGPVVLWARDNNNFKKVREQLREEFRLIEANRSRLIPAWVGYSIAHPLVFSHPDNPTKEIYRVIFNNWDERGPFIDFRYKSKLSNELLVKDLRAAAITRVSELIEIRNVTDLWGREIRVPYINY